MIWRSTQGTSLPGGQEARDEVPSGRESRFLASAMLSWH